MPGAVGGDVRDGSEGSWKARDVLKIMCVVWGKEEMEGKQQWEWEGSQMGKFLCKEVGARGQTYSCCILSRTIEMFCLKLQIKLYMNEGCGLLNFMYYC